MSTSIGYFKTLRADGSATSSKKLWLDNQKKMILGSHSSCDIRLRVHGASDKQACFELDIASGNVYIIHNGKPNTTFLGENALCAGEKTLVRDGDVISYKDGITSRSFRFEYNPQSKSKKNRFENDENANPNTLKLRRRSLPAALQSNVKSPTTKRVPGLVARDCKTVQRPNNMPKANPIKGLQESKVALFESQQSVRRSSCKDCNNQVDDVESEKTVRSSNLSPYDPPLVLAEMMNQAAEICNAPNDSVVDKMKPEESHSSNASVLPVTNQVTELVTAEVNSNVLDRATVENGTTNKEIQWMAEKVIEDATILAIKQHVERSDQVSKVKIQQKARHSDQESKVRIQQKARHHMQPRERYNLSSHSMKNQNKYHNISLGLRQMHKKQNIPKVIDVKVPDRREVMQAKNIRRYGNLNNLSKMNVITNGIKNINKIKGGIEKESVEDNLNLINAMEYKENVEKVQKRKGIKINQRLLENGNNFERLEMAEEERKDSAQDGARIQREQEDQRRIAAAEEAARIQREREEEEDERRRKAEEEHLAAAKEAARIQREQEEAARIQRKQEEEHERLRKAEKDRIAAAKEAVRIQREQEEAARIQQEEERERPRKAEEDRIAAAEEAARIQREQEDAARIQQEEEHDRQRKAEEERIAAAEEEARIQREQEEAARIQREQEEERERLRKAEEERIAAAEEAARIQREQDEECERLRKAEEERIAAAEEAARIQREQEEAARIQQEEEREKLRKAEEERIAAAEEAARIQREHEEERERLRKAEEERIAAAEEAARIQECERLRKAEEERIAAEAARIQKEQEEERERLRKAEEDRIVAAEEVARIQERERLCKAEEERIAAAEEAGRIQRVQEEERERLRKAEEDRIAAAEEAARIQREHEEERERLRKKEEECIAAAEEAARIDREQKEAERQQEDKQESLNTFSVEELNNMKVVDLRELCIANQLPTKGLKKAQLVAKLDSFYNSCHNEDSGDSNVSTNVTNVVEMSVKELRFFCEEKGIQWKGLNKSEMINLLESNKEESTLAVDTTINEDTYSTMKVTELKEECFARSIDTKGMKKTDLIDALKKHDLQSIPSEATLQDIPQEDKRDEKIPMENFSDMKVVELRAACKKKGLSTAGTKASLIERLESYVPSEGS